MITNLEDAFKKNRGGAEHSVNPNAVPSEDMCLPITMASNQEDLFQKENSQSQGKLFHVSQRLASSTHGNDTGL